MEKFECYYSNRGVVGRDGTDKCSEVSDEWFCYGCKQIICDNHNLADNPPVGKHEPSDHLGDE